MARRESCADDRRRARHRARDGQDVRARGRGRRDRGHQPRRRRGGSGRPQEQGARALPVAVNVADPASVSAMVGATLEAFGRIDILINNAGVGGNTPFLETASRTGTGSSASISRELSWWRRRCAREMVKTRRRQDRQHRLAFGPARRQRPRGVRVREGRARTADQGHGGRARRTTSTSTTSPPARSRPRWRNSPTIRRPAPPTTISSR